MRYKLINTGNDFLSLSSDEEVQIDARLYSTMSHNPTVLIPGMRDQSAVNAINYDTLGSVTLLEEMQQNVYDRQSLYQFVMGIINSLEKIFSLGVAREQILFDCSYMFVSLYDKSVRFICVPFVDETTEESGSPAEVFRTIALNVKSNGAYELIGYMIEQASGTDFSIENFKSGFEKVYSGADSDSKKEIRQREIKVESPEIETPMIQPDFFSSDSQVGMPDSSAEGGFMGMEYVPAGIPFVFGGQQNAGSDTIEPNDKTQMMFSGNQDMNNIPYLSPVENNSPEARIYIAGERLTIGRNPENDLHIDVKTVSGKHAEIHRSEGVCTVIDLNSTNKTYVNGEAITPKVPVKLKHNDLVAFNKVRYRFFNQ